MFYIKYNNKKGKNEKIVQYYEAKKNIDVKNIR